MNTNERTDLIERQKDMAKIMASYGHAGCAALLIESVEALLLAVPPGYALVPIEPTLEMMLQMPASSNSREWKKYYAGMLAAAQGAKK